MLHDNSHQRETMDGKSIFFPNLVGQWKSKEWAKFELECLLLIFIYSDSKLNTTLKTRYIRTHTKEKPSKISNTKLAILPLFRKKKYDQVNRWGHSLLGILHNGEFIIIYNHWESDFSLHGGEVQNKFCLSLSSKIKLISKNPIINFSGWYDLQFYENE